MRETGLHTYADAEDKNWMVALPRVRGSNATRDVVVSSPCRYGWMGVDAIGHRSRLVPQGQP